MQLKLPEKKYTLSHPGWRISMQEMEQTGREDGEAGRTAGPGVSAEKIGLCRQMTADLPVPDKDGKVSIGKLKEYLQSTLGAVLDQESADRVLESVEVDQDGMVDIEGFMKGFSKNYWSEENLRAMEEVLREDPDLLERMVDWKAVLAGLGLRVSEEQVKEVVGKARELVNEFVSSMTGKEHHCRRESQKSEEAEEGGKILKAVEENLHLLGFGEDKKDLEKCEKHDGN